MSGFSGVNASFKSCVADGAVWGGVPQVMAGAGAVEGLFTRQTCRTPGFLAKPSFALGKRTTSVRDQPQVQFRHRQVTPASGV